MIKIRFKGNKKTFEPVLNRIVSPGETITLQERKAERLNESWEVLETVKETDAEKKAKAKAKAAAKAKAKAKKQPETGGAE